MGNPSGRTKVVSGSRFPRILKLSFRMAIHWPRERRIGAKQDGAGHCEEVLSFQAVPMLTNLEKRTCVQVFGRWTTLQSCYFNQVLDPEILENANGVNPR